MWRLTVERKYKYISAFDDKENESTDCVHFEFDDLSELQCIISWFDSAGVDGKYVYTIARKEEGEENA